MLAVGVSATVGLVVQMSPTRPPEGPGRDDFVVVDEGVRRCARERRQEVPGLAGDVVVEWGERDRQIEVVGFGRTVFDRLRAREAKGVDDEAKWRSLPPQHPLRDAGFRRCVEGLPSPRVPFARAYAIGVPRIEAHLTILSADGEGAPPPGPFETFRDDRWSVCLRDARGEGHGPAARAVVRYEHTPGSTGVVYRREGPAWLTRCAAGVLPTFLFLESPHVLTADVEVNVREVTAVTPSPTVD